MSGHTESTYVMCNGVLGSRGRLVMRHTDSRRQGGYGAYWQ
jgi:trehalose/maltose hydrolase-like predicted phosphorylase